MKLLYLFLFISGLFYFGCERPTESVDGDDKIPPGIPEGLRIYYASDGDIIIDWIFSSEPDIRHYNIYRSTDSLNYIYLDSSETDFYFDDSLDYFTRYYYKVTAEDYSGNESGFSEVISAMPENFYAPQTPRNILINGKNRNNRKSIFLNWDNNEESDVKEYNIYREETEGFTADTNSFIAFTAKNEYEDTSVSEFYRNYYYRIKAVDKGGLASTQSYEVHDMVLEEPVLLVPAHNSVVNSFSKFLFRGAGTPANYKLIVQTNEFFGEIWNSDIYSDLIYDTVEVNVPSGVFYYNTNYYWRVAAYSSGSDPNSISTLNKFIIKP